MQTQHQLVVLLLRQFIEGVQSLSEQDIEALLAGKGRLSVSVEAASAMKQRGRRTTAAAVVEPTVIRDTLRSVASREEGVEYLRAVAGSRAAVQRIARFLDLPVRRGETVDRLREKIIEATIGFRLRSQAIRGSTAAEEP